MLRLRLREHLPPTNKGVISVLGRAFCTFLIRDAKLRDGWFCFAKSLSEGCARVTPSVQMQQTAKSPSFCWRRNRMNTTRTISSSSVISKWLVTIAMCAAVSCARSAPTPQQESGATGTTGQTASGTAETIFGTPGSATATMTISGKQLAPPAPKFGGVIKESYLDSTPWWPPRVVPT